MLTITHQKLLQLLAMRAKGDMLWHSHMFVEFNPLQAQDNILGLLGGRDQVRHAGWQRIDAYTPPDIVWLNYPLRSSIVIHKSGLVSMRVYDNVSTMDKSVQDMEKYYEAESDRKRVG